MSAVAVSTRWDADSSPVPASTEGLSEQQIANLSGRLMWAGDRAGHGVGIVIEDIAPGRARLSMPIRPEFTNGHGICHGGFIFLLADTAFAYACNSRNQHTVAAGADISFVSSAKQGDTLIAEGIEQHRGGRTGVYDVRVCNQDGKLIALFRGRSAAIKGQFIGDSK